MRTRKELIYLNIKDLTPEEIAELGNMGLSYCDNCGELEQSENLNWLDDDSLDDEKAQLLLESGEGGMTSICGPCFDMRDTHLANCGSCEQYFIANKEAGTDCPHCFSGNWVYGCIDEPEPENSPAKK
jgi:hypothetical protein